jgi:cytosine/uracil/thiamine/allantoin permease
VLGPLVAVYAVDILLRRNRYDGRALTDERRGSPFWYAGGVFWPGITAMVVATTLAALSANTTLYVGPISTAMGGADLSAIVGPLLGGGIYALLWLTTRPYRDPARRPAATHAAPDAPLDATRDASATDSPEPTTGHDETTDAAASAHRNLEVPA